MSIFTKIAKVFLYMIVFGITYAFFVDFGKSYISHERNYYIAQNSATYVSKFSTKNEDLADFTEKAGSLANAKTSLSKYFDMQYVSLGYERKYVSAPLPYQFKAVYYPKKFNVDTNIYEGPIFVRAKLYGFEGAPPSPYNSKDQGLIIVNIEQKIPATIRNFMSANGVKLGGNDIDYEGFFGYYSIIAEHSFSINVVK